MDSTLYILLSTAGVLLGLNMLLFSSSIIIRLRYKRWNKQLSAHKKDLMPRILGYLEEGDPWAVTNYLSGVSLQYHAFETLISDMLEYVEGVDAAKLRRLLVTKPVYEYHMKLLESDNDAARVKACVYFGTASLIDRKVVNLLKKNLHSTNLLLAFSAASALMSVSDIQIRAEALAIVARIKGLTEMAMVELMHKYHEDNDDQLEEEGTNLIPILEDPKVAAGNRSLLIMAIAEIGYYNLIDYLLKKLKKPAGVWDNGQVKFALIRAQGDFSNLRAIEVLRQYLRSDDPLLVSGAVEVLSDYGSESDLKVFRELVSHEDQMVREAAVFALLDNKITDSEVMLCTSAEQINETSRLILKYKTQFSKFAGV